MAEEELRSAVSESARDELVRAEAEVVRAFASAVKWLLGCIVALTGAAVIAVAAGHFALGVACLGTIGALGAVVGRAQGPRGRGRSSVM